MRRINYRLDQPGTANNNLSPLAQVYSAGGVRRCTTDAAITRPYTSPNRSSRRLRSMTNTRPYRYLPAIETKTVFRDEEGKLFVGNSETKPIVRDSTELSARKMSVMNFRDGKATST